MSYDTPTTLAKEYAALHAALRARYLVPIDGLLRGPLLVGSDRPQLVRLRERLLRASAILADGCQGAGAQLTLEQLRELKADLDSNRILQPPAAAPATATALTSERAHPREHGPFDAVRGAELVAPSESTAATGTSSTCSCACAYM